MGIYIVVPDNFLGNKFAIPVILGYHLEVNHLSSTFCAVEAKQ